MLNKVHILMLSNQGKLYAYENYKMLSFSKSENMLLYINYHASEKACCKCNVPISLIDMLNFLLLSILSQHLVL